MRIGPFLKLKDSAKYVFSLSQPLHLIIRNHSSVKALGNKKISLQSHCLTCRIDLHPLLCMLARLIDTVLDNNNPLIALNVVLMEMEMWKALH